MKPYTLDALSSKVPCRYEIVSVVTKRSRSLVDSGEAMENRGKPYKPVIQASIELYDGAYTYHHEPEDK